MSPKIPSYSQQRLRCVFLHTDLRNNQKKSQYTAHIVQQPYQNYHIIGVGCDLLANARRNVSNIKFG